ncbi:hypothetical protein Tco_1124385 [Tanacetum coccineum]|uniref:Uncharacterized protein n=1 Tax=Tanacetum coccineum TaxID=301880 RepID=A0ABQ5J7P5_9ASTR
MLQIPKSLKGGNQIKLTLSLHNLNHPQLDEEDFPADNEDGLGVLVLRKAARHLSNKSSSQALWAQEGLGGYDFGSNDLEENRSNDAFDGTLLFSSSNSSDNEYKSVLTMA